MSRGIVRRPSRAALSSAVERPLFCAVGDGYGSWVSLVGPAPGSRGRVTRPLLVPRGCRASGIRPGVETSGRCSLEPPATVRIRCLGTRSVRRDCEVEAEKAKARSAERFRLKLSD